eukprot:scaffold59533_cov38-Attheya_sp.AAC.1
MASMLVLKVYDVDIFGKSSNAVTMTSEANGGANEDTIEPDGKDSKSGRDEMRKKSGKDGKSAKSQAPSLFPSIAPSKSQIPSMVPSFAPSKSQTPSMVPSISKRPSGMPSLLPSFDPSKSDAPSQTSFAPSLYPSRIPSNVPIHPTSAPTISPTLSPSEVVDYITEQFALKIEENLDFIVEILMENTENKSIVETKLVNITTPNESPDETKPEVPVLVELHLGGGRLATEDEAALFEGIIVQLFESAQDARTRFLLNSIDCFGVINASSTVKQIDCEEDTTFDNNYTVCSEMNTNVTVQTACPAPSGAPTMTTTPTMEPSSPSSLSSLLPSLIPTQTPSKGP